MKILTKAKTLEFLKKYKKFHVPKLYIFKEKDFAKNKVKILNKIRFRFKKKVAIRSSSKFEDTVVQSMAGKFLSVLNIDIKNIVEMERNINSVISSYKKYKNPNNEVLIQEMVEDIFISGVVTTKDKNTALPYTNIDYSFSKDSSVVTSGSQNTFSITVWKNNIKENQFKILLKRINDLKKLFKNDSLDVEFAINKKGKVYILQVRPLIIKKNFNISEKKYENDLNKISKKIKKIQRKHYSLLGRTSYFGVMPDWNPAEMIGLKPKPLSLSLYKELITDQIWSIQRKNYGYKDLRSHHLLISLLGKPFIDLRVDFNSWIPKEIDNKLGEKLVNFYLDKFKKNLHLHDKIEFDIIYSCYTFSTNKRLLELKNKFTEKEINQIENSLKKITSTTIKKLKYEKEKIKNLENNFQKIINSDLYIIDKIYWLIEDCKKNGTEVFAGAARCGFVAIDLLNSLQNCKIISGDEKSRFLNSLKTISTKIAKDFNNFKKLKFIKLHGHLRPDTYEITSDTYKDAYNRYFGKKTKSKILKNHSFSFSRKSKNLIKKHLKKNKINLSLNEFLRFIREAIIFREYSKYIFTKNVSKILDYLKLISKRNKITIEEISYIDIKTILNMHRSLIDDDIEKILKSESAANYKRYNYYKNFNLPDNVLSSDDIFCYKNQLIKSNFVTEKNTSAKCILLNTDKSIPICDGKIVLIENADPGYEFLFTKNIKGIITKYGGVNSHMAIRCSELNIPAAIGVGEKKFENLKYKKYINLNCKLNSINFI